MTIKATTSSPFFNVLAFSAFWSLQIFVTKLGFLAGAKVLPFQIISMSAAFGVLLLTILSKVGTALITLLKEDPNSFWKLFFANAIQTGLGTGLSIIGISLTEAVNAGFLVKLSTVTTVLFAWALLQEQLSTLKVVTVFAMLMGAYLLTTKGQSLIPRVGDLFILVACVCWSLGNVLVRKILKTKTIQADVVTLQKPIASLPVFFVLAGIAKFKPVLLGSMAGVLGCCTSTPEVWPYALGSGFCLALTWIYLNRTLKVSSASYMTMMSMITPIFVSILAITFLGERLIWAQWIGAVMIILSGAMIYLSDIAQN
jgi:drug/metabolite transporter (DMT)-like permease